MTTAADLCLASLEDVAAQIASKQVSPVEVTEAVLARVERLNPQLNAFITVTGEQALAAAREAEREIGAGRYRGALHGVPIAIKDLFATKGVRTTAGSKILADWVPGHDATVVAKLQGAGAISVGKLGMHEFAYGGTSDNPHYGPVRNPWNTAHSPAGSSGGSGAATAAGLAFATLGSDTGGSIRMPASFNAVVGLMPTYGRASLYGAVPMSWSLDHPGPLARTVRDAAIVTQAISGRDPLDPTTEDRPVPDLLDGIERGPQGLRVGVPKQYFFDGCDPDVAGLVRAAIAALEGAGAEVRETDYDVAADYMTAWMGVAVAETAAYHAPTFPSRRDEYGKDVQALLDIGQTLPAIQYIQAFRAMQAIRAGGADALLDGVDVLAVPTMQLAAPTIEAARSGAVSGRFHVLTAIFDITGQPAISVPCGLTAAGLPVGITFVARRWDEATMCRAARAYEQARGPFPAPPIAR
jgi:aspartyl-tRNA(Asn)/glutamyl-tRNA(Gln) amidotransferase subunit A